MIHRSRLALPLLALLALAPLRASQAQSISFGITGGASLSTFTGDLVEDAKNYSTYIVGGFARIGAMGFAVQPGLYYTGKGAKSESASGTTAGTVKLNYIQVPLVLRLGIGSGKSRLYVGAGPAIGFKVSCKLAQPTTSSYSGTDCAEGASEDPVKSTEVSGIVEAGIEFGKFSIGARGDLGLTNAIESVQSGSTSNLGIKTRTVSAVAAIRF
ncbi:MAG: porin family protein [Gemmatimonadota bacterium]